MPDYLTVKLIHQIAVALSIAGFAARGAAALRDAAWLRTRLARTVPHVVDTVLLVSGVAMAWMLHLTAGNAPWLVAKIAGLIVYIAFGIVALRPATPGRVRVAAFAAAIVTALWIVSVALTKNPWGFFGVSG